MDNCNNFSFSRISNIKTKVVDETYKKFSKTKALNFITEILSKKLSSRFIFVSNNFRFGNKREGNVNLLKKYEKDRFRHDQIACI